MIFAGRSAPGCSYSCRELQRDFMFGLLNINKPSGITSRAVVDRVQRLVRPVKAGHAGTLDPLAQGVLVVGLGPATRLVPYVQQMPKTYRATFLLGRTSASEDTETEVTEIADAPRPTAAEIAEACRALTGEIQQRPPAYSAVKVAGRRSYALARAGESPELAARPVTIYRLGVLAYNYPELMLDIECSSGTYVRSLGRDLAESLGSGAVMSALVRTAIGQFTLASAIEIGTLDRERLDSSLLPAGETVRQLPHLVLEAADIERLVRGQLIDSPAASVASEIAGVDAAGRLIAILHPRDGRLAGRPCFAAAESQS